MTLVATIAVMTACCCNNENNKCENKCPATNSENICKQACGTNECCQSSQACLEGKWTISTVNGQQVTLEEMPFIEFNAAENKFHGNSGVNIMNGTFEKNGKKLTFGNAATTMMAGPEAATNVEKNILKSLSEVVSFDNVCQNKAELKNAKGEVLLVLTK